MDLQRRFISLVPGLRALAPRLDAQQDRGVGLGDDERDGDEHDPRPDEEDVEGPAPVGKGVDQAAGDGAEPRTEKR